MPIGFLNEFIVASFKGPGVNWLRKKWKKLLVINCISSVYFIVVLLLQWINCHPDLQSFAELLPLWVAQTMTQAYVFADMMLLTKENRILFKFKAR